MRLLFVSRSTPFHHLGGMEMVAWDLARALQRGGHEVELLTTRAPSLQDVKVIDDVTIRTLNVPSGRYSGAWWKQSADIFLSQYVSQVDLIISIGGGAHAILDASREHRSSVPIVLQSHGTPWGEIISKMSVPTPTSLAGAVRNIPFLLRDWRLGHYSHIIPIGPAVAEALRQPPMKWFVSSAPMTVIENGVDEKYFRFNAEARMRVRNRLGLADSARVVISVSRLTLQKGLRESLLGFAEVSHSFPEAVYLLAGEGPALPLLKNMVTELGLTGKVEFLGVVGRDELPDILSASDLFLFTSLRQEGLAIAPLEAAANGLPSVLSPHIVTPELNAIAAKPWDTAAVAAAIRETLVSSTYSRKSLLPLRYSLDYSMGRYETLFQKLVDRASGTFGLSRAEHGASA